MAQAAAVRVNFIIGSPPSAQGTRRPPGKRRNNLMDAPFSPSERHLLACMGNHHLAGKATSQHGAHAVMACSRPDTPLPPFCT